MFLLFIIIHLQYSRTIIFKSLDLVDQVDRLCEIKKIKPNILQHYLYIPNRRVVDEFQNDDRDTNKQTSDIAEKPIFKRKEKQKKVKKKTTTNENESHQKDTKKTNRVEQDTTTN